MCSACRCHGSDFIWKMTKLNRPAFSLQPSELANHRALKNLPHVHVGPGKRKTNIRQSSREQGGEMRSRNFFNRQGECAGQNRTSEEPNVSQSSKQNFGTLNELFQPGPKHGKHGRANTPLTTQWGIQKAAGPTLHQPLPETVPAVPQPTVVRGWRGLHEHFKACRVFHTPDLVVPLTLPDSSDHTFRAWTWTMRTAEKTWVPLRVLRRRA